MLHESLESTAHRLLDQLELETIIADRRGEHREQLVNLYWASVRALVEGDEARAVAMLAGQTSATPPARSPGKIVRLKVVRGRRAST